MIARTLVIAISLVLGAAFEPALRGQSIEKFEVASVRRVEIPLTDGGEVPVFPSTGGVGKSDPSRITYHATWLKPLIAEAFGVRADQIAAPEWLNTSATT